MKKYILVVLIIIIAGGLIYLAFGKKNASATINPDADIIYFHGKGCPHCAIVEDFMEKNNVKNAVSMEDGEIFFNKENAKIFKEKAALCNIAENQMGVPLLWVKGKCYTGDKDIISFFQGELDRNNQQQ
ncbi:MAG TPA: hypothetical protein VK255_04670 [Patescibacteria group bacterium]|nr:hypothetical protein [Patescibacteria group bacterium]